MTKPAAVIPPHMHNLTSGLSAAVVAGITVNVAQIQVNSTATIGRLCEAGPAHAS